ncbi:MAG: hypothetical protein ABJE95_06410 [Byssovorax sp.]
MRNATDHQAAALTLLALISFLPSHDMNAPDEKLPQGTQVIVSPSGFEPCCAG